MELDFGVALTVFRLERSRGGAGMAGWGMGRDSASSAQSKRAGGGETARLGSSWGKLGCTGVDGGVDGEWGMLTIVDSVVSDAAGV